MSAQQKTAVDAYSLGLPDYLVWLGTQLASSAASAYGALGVGSGDARIVEALGKNQGQHATSLAIRLGIDISFVSRSITKLKEMGWVVADKERRLSLTEAGEYWQMQCKALSDEELATLIATFSAAELERLCGYLDRLRDNLPSPAGGGARTDKRPRGTQRSIDRRSLMHGHSKEQA